MKKGHEYKIQAINKGSRVVLVASRKGKGSARNKDRDNSACRENGGHSREYLF